MMIKEIFYMTMFIFVLTPIAASLSDWLGLCFIAINIMYIERLFLRDKLVLKLSHIEHWEARDEIT